MTIYEKVAVLHNTTPEEVEREIRKALSLAGVEMEPESFINLIAVVVNHKAV